jgi:CHAT domain-containing protein/tetratricopeptide (TPR) repeat protein
MFVRRFAMMRLLVVPCALLFALTPRLAAEQPPAKEAAKPPFERLLKGEDAKKAADFEKKKDELAAADKYDEAIKLQRQVLDLRLKLQGADHWEAVDEKWKLDQLNKIASLPPQRRAGWGAALQGVITAKSLESKARYAQALPLRLEYSKWCQECLGDEHPDTATAYNTTAYNLHAQGKYALAEPLYRKALDICRKVLGEDHPDTAASYSGVAYALAARGKLTEAEPLYRKALEIYRKALGEDHRYTAAGYNNVGANLNAQGKYAEAEPFHRKALEIRRKALGEDHPSTALGYNNVGANLNTQGRYAEAGLLHRKALEIRRKALGEDHPDTAQSYHNLASNLDAEGKYAEAEPLYRKALEIRRKALGDEHPDTAASYYGVAANLNAAGKYAEAEPLCRKALGIRRKALGEDHPDTAVSYNNVAANLSAQGKYAEAEPLYRKALDIRRKVLGEEHPDTATGYNNVAANLDHQGKYAEAEALYRKALDISRKALGEQHLDTAISYSNVAQILGAQRKHAEAEPIFRKVLDIKRKALGEEHPYTALSYSNLAHNLQEQGREADAVEMWVRCAQSFEAARLAIAAKGIDRAEFGTSSSPYNFLAALQARSRRPAEAWSSLEFNLARSLLDEQRAAAPRLLTPAEEAQRRELAGRRAALEPRLLKLSAMVERSAAEEKELAALLAERRQISGELAKLAVELSQRQVATRAQVQAALVADAAWIAWVDLGKTSDKVQEHWVCVLRASGEPIWEKLPAISKNGPWGQEDQELALNLRSQLRGTASREVIAESAKALYAQRLAPIERHLQGIKRLHVVGVNWMAGIPVEVLTDKYAISYVPSGTFLARLKDQSAPAGARLLAVGDPVFLPRPAKMEAELPTAGILALNVLPGGMGDKKGLRDGDVLLRYAGTDVASIEQLLKLVDANARAVTVQIEVWRLIDGKGRTRTLDVPAGKFGIVFDKRPAREAIVERRQTDELLARRGPDLADLPGTRVEVVNLKKLLGDAATVLADSDASEQKLEEMRVAGELRKYRYLHFGSHGSANNSMSFESVLYLAQDRLPKELVSEPDKPFINGELSAREVLQYWKLDAELVTLSACETALGKHGGGDGLLGFAQAFLTAGSRAVCLSLWKVDDAATALLMNRFYENLLGKREGLTRPMPKAEALAEAKNWLRNVTIDEVTERMAHMTSSVARGKDQPALKITTPEKPKAERGAGVKPFAHPRYWAAFILIGDPN